MSGDWDYPSTPYIYMYVCYGKIVYLRDFEKSLFHHEITKMSRAMARARIRARARARIRARARARVRDFMKRCWRDFAKSLATQLYYNIYNTYIII